MLHQHLKDRAAKLGLKGADLASLVNLSAPKISNFFKGRTPLPAGKEKELIETLEDLERLRTFFPIPMGTHDIKELAVTLDRLREGKFNEFLTLMQGIAWTTPEGLERKFPKIFRVFV